MTRAKEHDEGQDTSQVNATNNQCACRRREQEKENWSQLIWMTAIDLAYSAGQNVRSDAGKSKEYWCCE